MSLLSGLRDLLTLDARNRRDVEAWITAPYFGAALPAGQPPRSVAWMVEHNGRASSLARTPQHAAPSTPLCESCRLRPAQVLVTSGTDAPAFQVCRSCAVIALPANRTPRQPVTVTTRIVSEIGGSR